jgi:amidophosphoribosyltransferase
MCGIVGIVQQENCFTELYDALIMLQHRGQDAAGMTVCENGHLHSRKSKGLVKEVFGQQHFERLKGTYGVGHVRYPTAGGNSKEYAQPMYVNSPYGIALAHNGNLSNTKELAKELFHSDLRYISTDSDSEVLLNILAHEISNFREKDPSPDLFFDAVSKTFERCEGSTNVISIITDYGLLAFRDKMGIRPLILGSKLNSKGSKDYMVASESAAFFSSGYEVERDLLPGEAIFISFEGNLFSRICCEQTALTPCLFEYVYFARPDSVIDGVNVYEARQLMGEKLAEKIKNEIPVEEIDVVIPIPESSISSGTKVAEVLKKELAYGFVKNRYVGRTFIMPDQQQRRTSVRRKLNPIKSEFYGKKVLLVDDSIVRGTTMKEIVQMCYAAGALKVSVASAAPEVKFPNVYGIDMAARSELVAHNRTKEEIRCFLGCDYLVYQSLEDLVASVIELNPKLDGLEKSIFDGVYPTDISEEYLQHLEQTRLFKF